MDQRAARAAPVSVLASEPHLMRHMGISPSPVQKNSAIRPCTSRAVGRPEHGNVSASYSYYWSISSRSARVIAGAAALRGRHCLASASVARKLRKRACAKIKPLISVIQRTPLPRTGSQTLITQLETARVDVRSVRTPRSRTRAPNLALPNLHGAYRSVTQRELLAARG